MATRSTIWIKKQNGNFDGVYCHNDGYLTANGAILLTQFKTADKIEKLIDGGFISALGADIETGAAFNYGDRLLTDRDCAVFFARDGGRTLEVYRDISLEQTCLEGFNYFFIDGVWFYKCGRDDDMQPLTPAAILKSWNYCDFIYPQFAVECLKGMEGAKC